MHTTSNVHVRYRRISKKPEFLHAVREERKLGRPTRGSELRMTHQILRSGENSSSCSLRPKGKLKSDSPSEQPRASAHIQEPIYLTLGKRLTRQLDVPLDKLYSFLLGSSITNELKQIFRQATFPPQKSTTAYNNKSKNEASSKSGSKIYQNHLTHSTSEKHRGIHLIDRYQTDVSCIHVSPTISKQLHLPKGSDTEGPGRPQDGSTVQLTIVGSPRPSFVTSLNKSNVLTGRSSRQGTNSPVKDFPLLTKEQFNLQTDQPNITEISPPGKRIVSIPYDPHHASTDLLPVTQFMCIVGSRPSSAVRPQSALNLPAVDGLANSCSNLAHKTDVDTRLNRQRRPRPFSAQIASSVKYELINRSETEVNSARTAGSDSDRTRQLERFLLSGHSARTFDRPNMERSREILQLSAENLDIIRSNSQNNIDDQRQILTTPIIQIPSVGIAEDGFGLAAESNSSVESGVDEISHPVQNV